LKEIFISRQVVLNQNFINQLLIIQHVHGKEKLHITTLSLMARQMKMLLGIILIQKMLQKNIKGYVAFWKGVKVTH